MTSQEILHSTPVGAYLWAYESESYGTTINTHLARVVSRQEEEPVIISLVLVKCGNFDTVATEERSFSDEAKGWRFAACSSWDAERWIADNAVEAKIKKKVAESEVGYKQAIGYGNIFAAMIGAPQASIVSVKEVVEDERGIHEISKDEPF